MSPMVVEVRDSCITLEAGASLVQYKAEFLVEAPWFSHRTSISLSQLYCHCWLLIKISVDCPNIVVEMNLNGKFGFEPVMDWKEPNDKPKGNNPWGLRGSLAKTGAQGRNGMGGEVWLWWVVTWMSEMKVALDIYLVCKVLLWYCPSSIWYETWACGHPNDGQWSCKWAIQHWMVCQSCMALPLIIMGIGHHLIGMMSL